MIISHKHKIIYVAIPKTGTLSIIQYMKQHLAGEQRDKYHSYHVPDDLTRQGYHVFTTTRNPYERCFSWWHWESVCVDRPRRGSKLKFGLPFLQFMDLITRHRDEGSNEGDFKWRYITQAEYFRRMGGDQAIKLENIANTKNPALHPITFGDARGILVVSDSEKNIQHSRKTPGKPEGLFVDHMTKEQEEAVWRYCAEDFDYFGYERRA